VVPFRRSRQETATCGNGPVVYCPQQNTVEMDLPELDRIGSPLTADGGGPGDFAAFAEVVSRHALARQHNRRTAVDRPSGS
jgi:hypothetical protein